jgi:hypothetical protein
VRGTAIRSRVRWSALGLLAATLGLASCSHQPGGDPGGKVLHELEPALQATIPPYASNVSTQLFDSTWTDKCPDNPYGKSGWSEVMVNERFTTSVSRNTVEGDVGSALVQRGWKRSDVLTIQGGPIVRWTKRVTSGNQAEIWAFPIPAGSQNWALFATWKPPGFALPGC